MRNVSVAVLLAIVLLGGWIGGLQVGAQGHQPARPHVQTRYVTSVSGVDAGECATASAPCATIQYAIDQAAAGDEIRIAAWDQAAPAVYTATTSTVISLSKDLTLRGGYVYQTMGGVTWLPGVTPSLIDGEGVRRGATLIGPVTPTLELLALVNGSAAQGGNLYAEAANLNLIGVSLLSGTAQSGGGLYCRNCRSVIDFNALLSGTLPAISGLVLAQGNSAQTGGGLYIDGGNPALLGWRVVSNTADADGGGLYLNNAAAVLAMSTVASNTALNGAGVYVNGPLSFNPLDLPILANNGVRFNRAGGNGGGLYLRAAIAVLANDLVADNSAAEGAGLYLYASSPQGFYNTLANNAGSGVYATHQPGSIFPPVLPVPSLPALTNTIIVSQPVGVVVNSTGLPYPLQNRLTLAGSLWWANATNSGGAGQIVSSTNVYSAPQFTCTGDAPACLNPYHLTGDSPAVDAGVAAVLPGLDRFVDIDLQVRPARHGFDLGVDEVPDVYGVFAFPAQVSGVISPGHALTYTPLVFNTGLQSDTYTLTLSHAAAAVQYAWPPTVFLSAQAWTDIAVRAAVALTAPIGLKDTAVLSITSWADPALSFAITATTTITRGWQVYVPVTRQP